MHLVDTNVVSELRKGPRRCDAGVASWFRATGERACFLSVISLMEIQSGALRLMRRDKEQAMLLVSWLASLRGQYAGRVLPVSADVAIRCAELHVPDPRPYRDALIGATAIVHNLIVVTRDTGHFEPMGVALLNPWEWGQ